MNDYVILACIASQIRDYATLMNFMLVNKKCLRSAKHIIGQRPAIYIALIEYETGPDMRLEKYVFNSLQELFTELHQKHMTEPPSYMSSQMVPVKCYVKNFCGPCDECLIDRRKYGFDGCGCGDINYTGIKMVKYFHTSIPKLEDDSWCPKIIPDDAGFRMSKTFGLPYNNKSTDYTSMQYLYNGFPKADLLLKLGLKRWWQKKHDRYYPATTENLIMFSATIYDGRPYSGDTYVAFREYNYDRGINHRANDI